MRMQQGPLRLELVQGDITAQADVDAIVNAANAQLMPGGGVAGAIHRAAGPELAEACRPLAPIHPGQAVITPAFRLPNRYVIHALGPVYGRDEPSDALLAAAYRNALHLADAHGLHSVAFPAISTGAFGFPLEAAARIALKTVLEEGPKLQHLRLVRFVLFDAPALEVHVRVLKELMAA
ncbi:O-acetyl-ADP-ribose deacetylase [Rhodothermus bifroesti]|uniref:O-acetyl-ADP-ribose deacetylase n=1 Tax=Rhodothermus marinus TaxID=29549 RepID=A0A7V2B2I7_RHOMR|nr:O-acetyl-ADP-ribose deacetylase [Rhodothermus bifroesti]GBD01108.1 O-acetyl-ADP-ribose deacetylase [bacterium HR18]